jgi:hypothetical protein
MLNDGVGLGNLPEGLALVALLPARFPVRRLPRTARPRRLLQPVAGRRLPTVGAVQAELALQLSDTGLQSRNQLYQFFPCQVGLRFAINHDSLNRNVIPVSRKMLPPHPRMS